ncbi:hypothetical protein [Peptoniphilus stercorisuis]|uniref:Type III secretory pathway component EscR n=1 Tax=Peptoniphilus stercorisuis TaxID=1436965 RepID=A0ABS4KDN8_9FIRM|nr:hypothetical protein [Peptoniphilus stercorisuis]MBP2025887.1 type III secretory pathway component EscR [Peptoniphilus stercorisuis]
MKIKDILIVALLIAVGFLAYDRYNARQEEKLALENQKAEEMKIDNSEDKTDEFLNKILEENGYFEIKDEFTKKEIKEAVKKVLEDDDIKNELKKKSFKLKDGKLNVEIDLKDLGQKFKNGAEISKDLVKDIIEDEINKNNTKN